MKKFLKYFGIIVLIMGVLGAIGGEGNGGEKTIAVEVWDLQGSYLVYDMDGNASGEAMTITQHSIAYADGSGVLFSGHWSDFKAYNTFSVIKVAGTTFQFYGLASNPNSYIMKADGESVIIVKVMG